MKRYLELGSVPPNEPCVQLGSENYEYAVSEELNRYKKLLESKFPNLPEHCKFVRKSNLHDFGTYYEIAITYDDNDKESIDFAFEVESNLPASWDES